MPETFVSIVQGIRVSIGNNNFPTSLHLKGHEVKLALN